MMNIATHNIIFRELVHWLWLWVLAALMVGLLQQRAGGAGQVDARLVPISITQSDNATLEDVLVSNQRGDYESVIAIWERLDVARQSVAWKHVGIGVAHLRLDNLDQAAGQFRRAVETDPENAVAEYFLGRVCQAKSRKVPFWYEKDDASPFRLIVWRNTERGDNVNDLKQRGTILPQYRSIPYDKQAKQHFRRAIHLSKILELDRVIEIGEPRIRLTAHASSASPVTIRDLLISLNEEDYVEKSRAEVQEQFVITH